MSRLVAALLLPVSVAGCLAVPPPAPALDPLGAPITSDELAIRKRTTHQALTSAGFALVGAAAGMLTGRPVAVAAGAIMGTHFGIRRGAQSDRDAAVIRISRDRMRALEPVDLIRRDGPGPYQRTLWRVRYTPDTLPAPRPVIIGR